MQGRNIAIVIGAIILVILLVVLVGGSMMGTGMMGPGMMGPGMMPFGWLVMLLVGALIIGGVVALAAWLLQPGHSAGPDRGPHAARPLDILRERYARGEISREEYERMRADLLHDGSSQ